MARIPLGAEFQRLHLLHACLIKLPERAYGTVIGKVKFVRADGTTQERPIRFGVDVLDWRLGDRELKLARDSETLQIAWQGERPGDIPASNRAHPHLCLFLTSIENERPETAVEAIEITAEKVKTSPFIVAMTTE